MFAAPHLSHTLTNAVPHYSATGSARVIARAYLDYVSACWRGDPDASKMGDELATFFGADMPVRPMRSADAYSPHGAGGRGIRWYECGDAVLGYVPGATSGYRIPLASVTELCSAAINVQLRGSIPLDSPIDSESGQRETRKLGMHTSTAHVVFPPLPDQWMRWHEHQK